MPASRSIWLNCNAITSPYSHKLGFFEEALSEHKESKFLEPVERVALAKVLAHDPLIGKMLKIVRQIPITAETSTDRFGEPEAIDHRANLNEADKRILRALDLATRKLD